MNRTIITTAQEQNRKLDIEFLFNGQELVLTSKTSTLCPALRGWQAEIACGVWAYQGVEFAAAPVELLLKSVFLQCCQVEFGQHGGLIDWQTPNQGKPCPCGSSSSCQSV